LDIATASTLGCCVCTAAAETRIHRRQTEESARSRARSGSTSQPRESVTQEIEHAKIRSDRTRGQAQVVIIGGGPVGLAAALELAFHNVKSILIEPRRVVSEERPRAKTTNVRTMEHFRRWGIANEVRALAGLPVSWSQDVVFCRSALGEEIVRFSDVFGLSSTPVPGSAESGQQIAQYLVEQGLRAAVEQQPNVTVMLGWRFEALSESADGVTARVSDEHGEAREIEASFLLGCDGARSAVREQIGVLMTGEAGGRPNLNFVAHAPGLMERQPHGRAVQYWILDPEHPGVMGPLDLRGNWWFLANGVEAGSPRADPEHILRRMVGQQWPATIRSIDPWIAQMKQADQLRVGRVFLVGDAAHLNPPWGGHGYNTGVGDAVDIGWKLSATLEGWGGPGLLDSYAREREPIHRSVIEAGKANMQTLSIDLALEKGSSSQDGRHVLAQRIRDAKAPEFHSLDFVLGASYAHSSLIINEQDAPTVVGIPVRATPGLRLPHTWLDVGHSIFDDLSPGFTLLMVDDADHRSSVERLQTAARVRCIPLSLLDLRGRGLVQRYGTALILVRPDQHVAWRGNELPDDVDGILDRVTGAAVTH
jgi:2-polyprenyl-6-methoxyphenol hydroxylase-like FAD-dependent oxidoreductase